MLSKSANAKNPDNFLLGSVLAALESAHSVATGARPEATARLIVAVSGGEDSVTLLDSLLRLAEEFPMELAICHVDHRLREESPEEAEFVRELARFHSLEFFLKVSETLPKGENLESWAREQRYTFFEKCREAFGAGCILTAHHQNDQAETLLFRLLTGRLLTQMHNISLFDEKRKLLRPLLMVPKSEIRDYVRRNSLSFVTDSSNLDLGRTRNRIRHDLLPKICSEYNPKVAETLSDFAKRASDDEDYLNEEVERIVRAHSEEASGLSFEELPDAIGWRVLRGLAACEVGRVAYKVGYRSYCRLLEFVAPMPGEAKTIELGFGLCARVQRSKGLQFFLD
ncbi:tRNA lysidine(34) synthetase TilS [bacterium J17]|nr:tRNA lysidine(34) synthetase TilS [bacterium J17]